MSEPVLRPAELKDVNEIARLRVLMQTEIRKLTSVDVNPEYIETLRTYFRNAIEDGSYLGMVMAAEDELIGSAGLTIYHKPPSLNRTTGKLGYVTNVYTATSWRRRGLAHKMMSALVELARERQVDRLHLGATEDGLSVYRRIGFKDPRHPHLELDFRN